MAAEREIDYEALAQSAMRGIVRTVLTRVAKSGLPGEHHFYIAFKTGAPGVILSKRLKDKYPDEMTVVLQHRFWDLLVKDDALRGEADVRRHPGAAGGSLRRHQGVLRSERALRPAVRGGRGGGRTPALRGARRGPARRCRRRRAAQGAHGAHAFRGGPCGEEAARFPPTAIREERGASAAADKAPAKHPAAKSTEPGPPSGPKVVSIDAFRKK